MKHLQFLLVALAAIFLISSCKSFPHVPLPPVYDSEGKPSDDTYVKWARDTRDLAKPGEIPLDPQEAFDEAVRVITEDYGLKIVQKPFTGKDQFDRFTTTLPSAIYVKPGFYDQDIRTQANTLWHEIVHVRQWKRLGVEQMAVRWTVFPEGRWSLETVAYRETARSIRRFHTSYDLSKWAPERAKSFWDSYALNTMSDYMRDVVTVDIWVNDPEFEKHYEHARSSPSTAMNLPVEHEHWATFVMNVDDASLTGTVAAL